MIENKEIKIRKKRKVFTTTIDVDAAEKLKKLAEYECRSQARTLEIMIRERYDRIC